MSYVIEVFMPFHDGRTRRQPGKYRVPQDLTPELAQAQLKADNAVKVNTAAGGAPETKGPMEAPESRESGQAKPSPSSPAAQASPEPTPRRRGRPPNASR